MERIIEILSPGEREELNRSQKKRTFRCLTHTKKSADYFCTTCGRLACGDCLLEQHLNHDGVKHSSDVLAEHLLALKGLIPGACETLKSGEKMLNSAQGLAEAQQREGADAIHEVRTYFAKIHEILANREKEVEREIVDQIEDGRERIEQGSTELQSSLQEFRECLQEIEQVSQSEGFEILLHEEQLKARLNSSKAQLESSCSEMTRLKSHTIKTPPLSDTKLEVLCRTLAAEPPTPLPRKRKENFAPTSSSPSSERISRLNSVDTYYALTPDISRAVEAGKEEMTDGFNASTESSNALLPEPPMRNESHRSSPTVIQPELVWGTQSMSSSFFSSSSGSVYPRGVCCGVSGTVLVTDVQNHCVRILASTGKCLDVIGREGKGDGMFGEPTAVTTDRDGNLLVCDLCPARLQKFTPQGACNFYIFQWYNCFTWKS